MRVTAKDLCKDLSSQRERGDHLDTVVHAQGLKVDSQSSQGFRFRGGKGRTKVRQGLKVLGKREEVGEVLNWDLALRRNACMGPGCTSLGSSQFGTEVTEQLLVVFVQGLCGPLVLSTSRGREELAVQTLLR